MKPRHWKAVLSLFVCILFFGNSSTSYAWPYQIAPLPDWSLESLKRQAKQRLTEGTLGAILLGTSGYLAKVIYDDSKEANEYSVPCAAIGIGTGAFLVANAITPIAVKDIIKSCYLSEEDMKLRNLSYGEANRWGHLFPTEHSDPAVHERQKRDRSKILHFVSDQLTDGELDALMDLLQYVNSTPEELELFYQYTKMKRLQGSEPRGVLEKVVAFLQREEASHRKSFMDGQEMLIRKLNGRLLVGHTHPQRSQIYSLLNEWNEARAHYKNEIEQKIKSMSSDERRALAEKASGTASIFIALRVGQLEERGQGPMLEEMIKEILPKVLFARDPVHMGILFLSAKRNPTLSALLTETLKNPQTQAELQNMEEGIFGFLSQVDRSIEARAQLALEEIRQRDSAVDEQGMVTAEHKLLKSLPFVKDLYVNGPGEDIFETKALRAFLLTNPVLFDRKTVEFFSNSAHLRALKEMDSQARKEEYILQNLDK